MNNSFAGRVKLMWTVDQVKLIEGTAADPVDTVIFGFTKIGRYMLNPPEELWFLASDNLRSESDASKVAWRLLPDGDTGLLPPGVVPRSTPPTDPVGDVFEEAHVVPLRSGGTYAIGRTQQGFLGAAHTNTTAAAGLTGWSKTGYAAYGN